MKMLPKTHPVVTLANSGVAQAVVTTRQEASGVILHAEATNTGTLYVGDENVTTALGIPLLPGATLSISVDSYRTSSAILSLQDIYIVGATTGDKLRVMSTIAG